MNVVITGANGFIGSWLIKELIRESDHMIYAFIRRGSNRTELPTDERLSIIEINYNDKCKLEEVLKNKDIVIHLIGQMGAYGVAEKSYYQVNVELTKMLLEISEKVGIKQFIFCSTPGVQGFGHRLAEEEEVYAPRNEYEKNKSNCRTADYIVL